MPGNKDETQTVVVDVHLTQRELSLVCEALDSHVYWQLSDERYRRDGYVNEPGSDDEDNARGIAEAEALLRRLGPAQQEPTSAESS